MTAPTDHAAWACQPAAVARRGFLRSSVAGSLLMPGILSQLLEGEAAAAVDQLAVKPPHFPAKAKRIIFLFMTGGV